MIDRRAVVRALTSARVSDWVVIDRRQELARVDEPRALRRQEQRARLAVIVRHDTPRGRGSARLELGAEHGSATDFVKQATALAAAAVGPTWRASPPSAPAKVEVLDEALARADLVEIATAVLASARRPAGTRVAARVDVLRERVSIQSRAGLAAAWTASHLHASALVTAAGDAGGGATATTTAAGAGAHVIAVARESRRVQDLGLDATLAEAAADLRELVEAGAPTRGPATLVLAGDALLHGHDGLGVWSVFAAQADATLERRGLGRYRLDAPIAAGADAVAEPLTITSDGALDYAARSAPMGDDGDAVRRFALVERGVCRGLGLSTREAAFRRRDPNGGVRNLLVVPGTWGGELSAGAGAATRIVEVRRLRGLAIDPYTGAASLELGLAIEHDPAGARRAFAGGAVRIDLVAALASARRSAATIRRGAYHGPRAVLVEGVELIA